MQNEIQFLLNEDVVKINNIDPNTTVLKYLRDLKNLRGTKEGCASGDCGACTAVTVEIVKGRLVYRSINTCIMFLYSLHGKQLITVEHLKKNNKLHPVQRSMIDHNGSQCGFCTPGFIMSMFSMFKNREQTSKKNIDRYLTGNLCRCTGYKPINLATKNMYSYGKSDHFYKNEKNILNKLKSINRQNIKIKYFNKEFFIPSNLIDLKENIKQYNNCKFISGGTDIALEVTKRRKDFESIIYLGNNKDLKYIKIVDKNIVIGAATPINDTLNILKKYYPSIAEMYFRFGSLQIRNVATIGGNISNASPIGDSAPALISLDSSLIIEGNKTRTVKLKNFFLSYKKTLLKNNEFIKEKIKNFVIKTKYKGILYTGLIVENPNSNNPKIYVLEFNCRLGDPETQSVLQHFEPKVLSLIFEYISSTRLSCIKKDIEKMLSNDKNMYLTFVLSHNLYPEKKAEY